MTPEQTQTQALEKNQQDIKLCFELGIIYALQMAKSPDDIKYPRLIAQQREKLLKLLSNE
jgi:hypothetical protein